MLRVLCRRFAPLFIGSLLSTAVLAAEAVDPYADVVQVTNTVAWPYNETTYGNESFQPGSSASGNADTLLLEKVDKQDGLPFPDGFAFGVAHSAYQYEGNRLAPSANRPNGIGWSIWDVFSQKKSWLNPQGTNIAEVVPTSRYTQPNGADAIMGYYPPFYRQDMQLAKRLGVNYYRISISWPRLFPKAGMTEADPEAIEYYQTVLKDLKEHGFNVLVTLYHWDLPAWLYNYGDPNVAAKDKTYGWLDMSDAKDNLAIQEFQKYAAAVFQHFAPYTPYFATFNEPLTFSNSALYQGVHAPGKAGFELLRKKSPELYGHNAAESDARMNYLQGANVIKAHYVAYKTFDQHRELISQHNNGQPALLGIVLNSDWAEPYRIIPSDDGELRYHPDDVKASKRNMDFMLGWWLDPVMYGRWPASMQQLVGKRLPDLAADASCLAANGQPVACADDNDDDDQAQDQVTLAQYIQAGGALDYLNINHYTGYFAADLDYAKQHFSAEPAKNSVAPSQYGATPHNLPPGWDSDQRAFLTQFRYQKYGDSGEFAGQVSDQNSDETSSRAYIIGRAGAKPWLRHTYFAYTKLLQYINYYYLQNDLTTKQNLPYRDLGIYLTENGTSLLGESQKDVGSHLQDPERVEYIKGNLAAVWDAVQQGINVKLYTYWSVADNFEWSEGYDSRFGLIWIDYQNNFKREPKQSYTYYQQCIRHNAVMP